MRLLLKFIAIQMFAAVALFGCSKYTGAIKDIEYFQSLYNDIGNKTAFLFFTDPHMDHQSKRFKPYLTSVKATYDRLPLEFCICGGDWLNDKDTQDQAIDKLKHIDSFLEDCWGDDQYMILGNHDTNYQGKYQNSSEPNTGIIDHERLVNILFHKQGNSYYTFSKDNTLFVILDTGIDWEHEMCDFRWEQIQWLANILSNNNYEHIILCFHIFSNNLPQSEVFANNILELCETFNNRGVVELYKNHYDFCNAYGVVSCCICGHNHSDFINYDYSIPVIGTTQFKEGDMPTYDLCLVDWDKNIMYMIRVGEGKNRFVELTHN